MDHEFSAENVLEEDDDFKSQELDWLKVHDGKAGHGYRSRPTPPS